MAIIFLQIEVDAPPAALLDLIGNFGLYPTWNPIIRRIDARRDGRLALTMHPAGLWPIVFEARYVSSRQPTQIVFSGFWLHPRWLRLEHRLEIETLGSHNRSTLRQTVRLVGLSQKIFPYFMMRPIRTGFQRMNEALRDRLERDGHETAPMPASRTAAGLSR